ncbi:MAG: hypothetical protein WCW33_04640 [Candidatus Babeliales bacterium]|jgi:hypothetical protein
MISKSRVLLRLVSGFLLLQGIGESASAHSCAIAGDAFIQDFCSHNESVASSTNGALTLYAHPNKMVAAAIKAVVAAAAVGGVVATTCYCLSDGQEAGSPAGDANSSAGKKIVGLVLAGIASGWLSAGLLVSAWDDYVAKNDKKPYVILDSVGITHCSNGTHFKWSDFDYIEGSPLYIKGSNISLESVYGDDPDLPVPLNQLCDLARHYIAVYGK